MQQLGLIAGGGQFPLIAAKEAAKQGFIVHAIAIEEETSREINKEAQKVSWIKLGQLSKLVALLKRSGIKKVLMAGKVAHRHIFSQTDFDEQLKNFLANLKDKSGDSILEGLTDLLNQEGIEVIDSTQFVSAWLAPKGVLSRRKPTKKELKDIQYGRSIAAEIAQLHIGQSIAVKNGAVIAVEAMEGTDEMILRAGKLGGEGVVIVKVSHPQKDNRFDMPVVGSDTVSTMLQVEAKVLAFESEKTLLFNKEEMIRRADQGDIALFSF